MKMLLLHVWNATERSYRGRFSSMLSYPSLTLSTLAALIPEGLFETVDIVDEMSQAVSYEKPYDLVALSFDTSSSISAYRHAAEFKKRGAYTACGGYHPSALPDEAAHCFDTVIIGAGERSFPRFLREFAAGHPQARYDDQSVRAEDYRVPARGRVTKHKYLKIPSLIADRGCNNRCSFCAISQMWRSNPRPVEDVIAEVKSLRSKLLIFYDPNFFGKRDYALHLMAELRKLRVLWATNATADFGFENELMDAARDSGCRGVLFGLESVNKQSLRDVHKRFWDVERYREAIANVHQRGIAVNGCFVLGFDHDTEEELLSIPRQVRYLGLDLTRFAILTPLPGSRIFQEYDSQGRILTRDWSLYTQHHAVFQPRNMSPRRLEEIYRQVWWETYRWNEVFYRVSHSPWRRNPLLSAILLGASAGFKFLDLGAPGWEGQA